LYLLANVTYFVTVPIDAIQTVPADRVAAASLEVALPEMGSSARPYRAFGYPIVPALYIVRCHRDSDRARDVSRIDDVAGSCYRPAGRAGVPRASPDIGAIRERARGFVRNG
jgi:hypothetical protein